MSTSQDALNQIAQAIAQNEGYNVQGSLPQSLNNPGDLTSNGKLLSFPSPTSGWSALLSKLQNIFAGTSKVYSPDMTLNQFANTYTGGDPNAANNIASSLGVNTSDTLQQIAQKLSTSLQNGAVAFNGAMQGAATSVVNSAIDTTVGTFGKGNPLTLANSVIYRAIAVVAGLILIAGAVWGFDNIKETVVTTAREGARAAVV